MDAYFYIILVVGLLSTLICAVAGILKMEPIAGEAWEFWGYLGTALLLPVAAVYWSVLERTRWSNFVLAAVGVTALVMAARMNQIWY